MKFSVFQISRKGGRDKNEDRMGYCYTDRSAIFLLADGMGGHPEGEMAAQLALQTISALFQEEARPVLTDVRGFIDTAVMAAHRRILRYAADKSLADNPRTTLVVAVVQGGVAYWAHCGDSRFYFVRSGQLLARTLDHSYLVQRQGERSADEALPSRNILFTCLGSPSKPVLDVAGPLNLQFGDRMMLCSDGLWGNLQDEDIVNQLQAKPVHAAAPELVDQALLKGGAHSDNVTLVAVEWEAPDAMDSQTSVSSAQFDDGVFASTVQTGWVDAAVDDLDDATIERSIAEINEAIRRAAARKP